MKITNSLKVSRLALIFIACFISQPSETTTKMTTKTKNKNKIARNTNLTPSLFVAFDFIYFKDFWNQDCLSGKKCAHICKHTNENTLKKTHTHTHQHTHTNVITCKNKHTHICKHTHTHTHQQTHAYTCKHTNTPPHTHTHI